MTIAKHISVLQEAMLIFVEPRCFGANDNRIVLRRVCGYVFEAMFNILLLRLCVRNVMYLSRRRVNMIGVNMFLAEYYQNTFK